MIFWSKYVVNVWQEQTTYYSLVFLLTNLEVFSHGQRSWWVTPKCLSYLDQPILTHYVPVYIYIHTYVLRGAVEITRGYIYIYNQGYKLQYLWMDITQITMVKSIHKKFTGTALPSEPTTHSNYLAEL